jgi:hypothetical protein
MFQEVKGGNFTESFIHTYFGLTDINKLLRTKEM